MVPLPQTTDPSESDPLFPAEDGPRVVRGAIHMQRLMSGSCDSKVCVIDDENVNCRIVRKYLIDHGFTNVATTNDPFGAFSFLRSERPDVVILDLMMPGVSGLDLMGEIAVDELLAHVPVLILTACDDREVRMQALDLGVSDFLTKPIDPTDLVPRVRNAITTRNYQKKLRIQNEHLEEIVRKRTEELTISRMEVVHCLGRAADYRDNETGKHVQRVGLYSGIIARQLRLSPAACELLELAAPLHDVGKIGIVDAILHKPAKLTPDEFGDMKRHCQFGYEILGNISSSASLNSISIAGDAAANATGYRSPVLKLAALIALTHHEKWDGSGYPRGLSGEDIPIEGRITSVADVFDALSTKRAYKPAFPVEKCFGILEEGRGTAFDPAVLDAFFAASDKILRVQSEYADPQ
jgi:putative two-component system response regulator